MKKPENNHYPIAEHRLLAEAGPRVKEAISVELRVGGLARRIVLARTEEGLYAGIPVSTSKTIMAFAVRQPDSTSFEHLDALLSLKSYAKIIQTPVPPHLMAMLLSNKVDIHEIARNGILIADHERGSDIIIDDLLTSDVITRVEGNLVVPRASTLSMNGVTAINKLTLAKYCAVTLAALDRAGDLYLEGSSYLTTPSLVEVNRIKGWPRQGFVHSIKTFHDPFAFEVAPSEDIVVPVVPMARGGYPNDIVATFGSVDWVRLEDSRYKYAPSTSVLDLKTGAVIPASVLLLRETPAGALARNIIQRHVPLKDLTPELILSLRSDTNGEELRAKFSAVASTIAGRADIPVIYFNTAFSLTADMSATDIVNKLNHNPLSLVHGETSWEVALNPGFQKEAMAAGSSLAVGEHIAAVYGTVIGVSKIPTPPSEADRWRVLTDKGALMEISNKCGTATDLGYAGAPFFDAISDMVPQPPGYLLGPTSIAKHYQLKSTLLHVALDHDMRMAGLRLSDLLPEYSYLMEVPDAAGDTPLLVALRTGNLDALETLVDFDVSFPTDAPVDTADVLYLYKTAIASRNLAILDVVTQHVSSTVQTIEAALEENFTDAAVLQVESYDRWQKDTGAVEVAIRCGSEALFETAQRHIGSSAIDYPLLATALKSNHTEFAKALINKTTNQAVNPDLFGKLLLMPDRPVNQELTDLLIAKSLSTLSSARAR